MTRRRVQRRIAFAAMAMLLGAGATIAQWGKSGGDWQSYAADRGSTKYSPLDQIDATNVAKLAVAWQWESVDYQIEGGRSFFANLFETTPIAIDGVLYMSSGGGLAAAIDGATGKTKWTWKPEDEGWERSVSGLSLSRGLGSWRSGEKTALLMLSGDKLVSLDAATGRANSGFGKGGYVDMKDLGEGREPFAQFFWTSPPLVCGDVVVLGNSTTDPYNMKSTPPGVVRGYDVRSGALKWIFDIIPRQGQDGYDTWEDGSADYTGHGNVWTWMSCDEEAGIVYAPTSTPTDDWYGGHRHGAGLFAESLVALRAETGERLWHFQAVHHGLWDYDFPAGPILVDIAVDGKPIKAVAQVSKQAMTYVFDRISGEPVWPIVERPVPASDAPGEKAWPTQPIPTKPAPYDLHGITEDDLIDFTPELHAEAVEILSKYRTGPIFLPPIVAGEGGKEAAIQSPGAVGGSDWNGAALDPETGILYVPSVTAPMVVALEPPARGDVRYVVKSGGFLAGPQGLPPTKPPWGRITAIDLNTGDVAWMVANGDGPRDDPALAGLDLPPLGNRGRSSPLVTKTLLFAADGSPDMIAVPPHGGGRGLRAFDKKTGKKVFEMQLPAGATGAPMTYLAGGKQYLVVPVGERLFRGTFVALTVQD